MAEATTKRPKGFDTWRPQRKTRVLLDQIMEIFDLYEDELPLTARQVYYVLVGRYEYPKDTKETKDRNYNRLLELLVRARRAQVIPFGLIRDDGTRSMQGRWGYYGEDSFWNWVDDRIENYIVEPTLNQPYNVEVWCETYGMIPQLSRVVKQFGVPVYSNSGFTSVTATHDVACRIVQTPKPTVFLHIGDFDPSGVSIFEAMSEDIGTFVDQYNLAAHRAGGEGEWGSLDLSTVREGCDFIYHRVALTEEQVLEYDLPLAHANENDSRSASWVGGVAQAEALPPDVLARILKETVEEYWDPEVAARNKAKAKVHQEHIRETFKRIWPKRIPHWL